MMTGSSSPPLRTAPANNLFVFYKGWELWVCILLSLFLQIFLVAGGTCRKLAPHKRVVNIIWLANMLAEFVAVFGLGLIVSKQSLLYSYCKDGVACVEDNILMFWAPFFLVHLGGPDTITAFATVNNELWLGYLFSVASKFLTILYAFYQALCSSDSMPIIPFLLMFLCGTIKCAERTCALYYGSTMVFRKSKLDLEVNNSGKKEAKLLIKINGDALSHLQVLQYAFVYFTTFKGLVADLSLSIHARNQIRDFFLARSRRDAFRLVEVELNYLYDVIFTKIPVLHNKLGLFCRTLSFIAVVASLVLFIKEYGMDYYDGFQYILTVTYILLSGAIVLELIAFYMVLFCDWTVVKLRPLSDANPNRKSWKDKFLDCILFVNNARSAFFHCFIRFIGDRDHHTESEFTDSRWANSLSTFNLIYYCLHKCSKERESFYSYFGLLRFLNGFWYVKPQPLTHHIADFIFDELKKKSEMAGSLAMAKEICSSKGEWVLNTMEENRGTFLPFVANYNYDDILLMWHIATEVCHNDSQDQVTNKEHHTAKHLSDYMLYLMVLKPDMMSAVSSIGEIKFRDTCTQVSKFFDTELPELKKRKFCNFSGRESKEEKVALQRKACEKFLNLNRKSEQRDANILFTASVLAKHLKDLSPERKWLILSKFWVELLSYAASHIKSSAHAEQLGKGGELITVVWLLMANFGLGDQYEIKPGKQA